MKEVKRVNWFILGTVLFVLCAAFAMQAVTSMTLNIFLSAFIYMFPMLIYYIIWGRKTDCIRFKKVKISVILKCVVLYICILPVLTLLNAISMLYSQNEAANVLVSMNGNTSFGVTLIVVAVIPPIFEELTYRGVIYGTYRKVNPLWGIILTGLVFGLMHGNLNQFTYAVALGMMFCLIVEATDSIVTTMVMHSLVNAFSVCLVYLLDYAVKLAQSLYEEAVAAGDTMTLELLDTALGGQEIDSLDSLLSAAQSLGKYQAVIQIVSCLMPAAIGGILAFLLYRNIARSCGTWEHIVSIFKRPGAELVPEYHTLWTPGLIVACVIMVAEMALAFFV